MKQLWRCPVCGHEYTPALPCSEVLCSGKHGASSGRQMQLVEGELPRTELNRKKATSGNRQNRRR